MRNLVAVLAGLVIGSTANMLTLQLGMLLIPLPEGADVSNWEALKASMPLFEPKNFIAPFLAHALGTLVGVIVGVKIARSNHNVISIIIGAFFLLGGIVNVAILGGPMWFNVLDLAAAYVPMVLLGRKLAGSR